MDTFANRLRFARSQRKLSQGALARASGLSQGAISSYETGHRKTTKQIFRLAEVLKVSATWLSLGTGPMVVSSSPSELTGSNQKVHDVQNQRLPGPWPFKDLQEAEYWALSEEQRGMVEHVVTTLVRSLPSN